MDKKLEQLTQKLYNEGLQKGRGEAERLVEEAKGKAAKLVAEANREADGIVAKARADAEELRKNTLTEVSLAGRGAVARIKDEISNLIVAKTISGGLHEAGLDPEFLKKMVLDLARGWSTADGKVSLQALLPETRRAELDKAFTASAGELLAAGIEVGYSPEVKSGFRIGEKGGGYYIGFGDENLEALLGAYLRPKVAELLFEKR